jgi:hypothetical protein
LIYKKHWQQNTELQKRKQQSVSQIKVEEAHRVLI